MEEWTPRNYPNEKTWCKSVELKMSFSLKWCHIETKEKRSWNRRKTKVVRQKLEDKLFSDRHNFRRHPTPKTSPMVGRTMVVLFKNGIVFSTMWDQPLSLGGSHHGMIVAQVSRPLKMLGEGGFYCKSLPVRSSSLHQLSVCPDPKLHISQTPAHMSSYILNFLPLSSLPQTMTFQFHFIRFHQKVNPVSEAPANAASVEDKMYAALPSQAKRQFSKAKSTPFYKNSCFPNTMPA